MPGEKILLVDDDPTILGTLTRFLTSQGFAVVAAPSGREALTTLQEEEAIPLAILDLKLPDFSGLELLAYVRENSPDTEVILFTGLGALDSAIQALRLGAYDYLVKTELRLPELHNIVDRALERRRLALANRELLENLKRAQEELAATRAQELTQIRRIGETLSRPLTVQEWMDGLLDLMWESLPLTLLGVRFQGQKTLELSAACRHLPHLPAEALERFDRWLDLQLQDSPSNPAGDHPSPCTAILQQRLLAGEVLGLVAAGRDEPFSAEEDELFHIFALQGEAALKNLLLFEEVKSLAIRDGLTGLYNYRYLHEVLTHQLEVSRRYDWPLSLLFLDIDDFKIINDTRGHPEGDLVLKALADFLQTHVRQADMICRYGGEEFVVLMPQSSKIQAFHLADRLREGIAATPIALSQGQVNITVSIGVASLESHMSGEDLVKTADGAMYQAKQSGKNRVCCPEGV
ncbi:MAG: diguanylate cyclase [Syntrophobacterales bacterium]|jgi:diguanylate cyclase (GGDEF)-like protein